ncbi:MAG: proline dehydrogenase family protein [Candidatus Micrarchaeota archaeon]|nr:proline dehydrogenase family protein [Candidatus Micrarchaeota archaeon]
MSGHGIFERLFAGRWIAGPDIDDAISVARRFNGKGVSAVFNYLGEDLKDKGMVEDAVQVYSELIKRIGSEGIVASISVKPTQLGASISYKTFLSNYTRIVKLAKKNGVFVWFDMESSGMIDTVIRAYRKDMKSKDTGICLQAYLTRSYEDAVGLCKKGAIIRLVKGAYNEPPDVAYQTKEAVTSNYVRIMEYLFRHSKRFMIATHDLGIIEHAHRLDKGHKGEVEYAMLNGIRNRYAVAMAKKGDRVAVYIPFGRAWLNYSYRRLKEAGHISLVLKSIFEDQGV